MREGGRVISVFSAKTLKPAIFFHFDSRWRLNDFSMRQQTAATRKMFGNGRELFPATSSGHLPAMRVREDRGFHKLGSFLDFAQTAAKIRSHQTLLTSSDSVSGWHGYVLPFWFCVNYSSMNCTEVGHLPRHLCVNLKSAQRSFRPWDSLTHSFLPSFQFMSCLSPCLSLCLSVCSLHWALSFPLIMCSPLCVHVR